MARNKKETEVAEDQTDAAVASEEATEEVNAIDVAIRASFDDNIDNDEETTKMAMLQAGCKIKSVSRLYNTFMVDSGQMASKEEKDTALDAALKDVDLSDEDTFNEAVTDLATSITGASEQSAATMVRAWAKRNEAECYAKPKGEGRSTGFIAKFHTALIADPEMNEKACKDFVHEHGTENTIRHITSYQKTRKLVNDIHASLTEVAEAA